MWLGVGLGVSEERRSCRLGNRTCPQSLTYMHVVCHLGQMGGKVRHGNCEICGVQWEQRGPGRPKKLCGERECRIAYIVRWQRAKRAEAHHLKKWMESNDELQDTESTGTCGDKECVS
jgi:hypothetical protein